MFWFYLFVAGLFGGVLAGMTGVGGGIVYVFVLEWVLDKFGVLPLDFAQIVIANLLFCVFFAFFYLCITLYRRNEFYFKEVFYVAISSVITVIVTFFFEIVSNSTIQSSSSVNVLHLLLLFILFFLVFFIAKKPGIALIVNHE